MKISVWITSYNQKDLLREAIESVLSQTLKPFEIIIVDDCSSDGSQELIRSYENSYPGLINSVLHEKNKGVAQVRISALQKIKGEYVTYLDGDDLFLPAKLETEARLIKQGDFQLAFSNTMYFEGDPDNVQYIWAFEKSAMPAKGNMYFETLSRSFPRSSLFRMELVNYQAWKQIGFHDSNLSIYEDFDMRIRLTHKLNVNYTLTPLAKVRMSNTGLSKSTSEVHLKNLKYIFNKYQDEIATLSPDKAKIVREKFTSMIRYHEDKQSPSSANERKGLFGKYFKKTGK